MLEKCNECNRKGNIKLLFSTTRCEKCGGTGLDISGRISGKYITEDMDEAERHSGLDIDEAREEILEFLRPKPFITKELIEDLRKSKMRIEDGTATRIVHLGSHNLASIFFLVRGAKWDMCLRERPGREVYYEGILPYDMDGDELKKFFMQLLEEKRHD